MSTRISHRNKKHQRKAERRAAELKRQHEAAAKHDAERREAANRERDEVDDTVYETRLDTDFIVTFLAMKFTKPYDVWTSVYQTTTGEAIPYLFIADVNTPGRTVYMDMHREEVYDFIEDSYKIAKEDLPESQRECVIVATNSPDDKQYFSLFVNTDTFQKFANIAGVGEKASGYVTVSKFVGPNTKCIRI